MSLTAVGTNILMGAPSCKSWRLHVGLAFGFICAISRNGSQSARWRRFKSSLLNQFCPNQPVNLSFFAISAHMIPAQQSLTLTLAGQVQVGTTCTCVMKIRNHGTCVHTHICRRVFPLETLQTHKMDSSDRLRHVFLNCHVF